MTGPCPCGTGLAYPACCGPRHDGTRPAETPEALMRSRYAAFALGDARYLVATHLGSTEAEVPALTRQLASTHWLGLTVTATEPGATADEGFVTFTARGLEGGGLVAITERSLFRRAGGRWQYVDGEPAVKRTRLDRNAPCPCGSGRKSKQCHG